MTCIGVVGLFNVTNVVITLKIPSTNQITGNQKWCQLQTVHEIIPMGNIFKNYSFSKIDRNRHFRLGQEHFCWFS